MLPSHILRGERLGFLVVIPSTRYLSEKLWEEKAILTIGEQRYWKSYVGQSWDRFRVNLFFVRHCSSVSCHLRAGPRPDSNCGWGRLPSIVGRGGRVARLGKQTKVVARLQEIPTKNGLRLIAVPGLPARNASSGADSRDRHGLYVI